MDIKILIFLITCLSLVNCGTNHAVIVVGSRGYNNYRHQSNGCKLYNLLIEKGMPAENIIHLNYDDIADSEENPFPGKIFNKPSPDSEGEDVYENCKIDYRREAVNIKTFAAVLLGDAEVAGGRVLNSTSEDHVFVFFDDHGASNALCFPEEQLHKDELHTILRGMNEKKLYKKLVFYIEACFSGSMFKDNLEEELNIYAVTAANENELHYLNYCPPFDVVNGVHLNTCLSGQFSSTWFDNLEQLINPETFLQQFDIIKQGVTKSHVMKYGDLSFIDENVLDFESGDFGENKFLAYKEELKEESDYMKAAKASVIAAPNATHVIKRLIAENDKNNFEKENAALEMELSVLKIQKFFSALRKAFGLKMGEFGGDLTGEALQCYKNNVKLYLDKNGRQIDFAYSMLGYIQAACSKASEREVADFIIFN